MVTRNLSVFFSSLILPAFLLFSCSKKQPELQPEPEPPVTSEPGYLITEKFENGQKTAYAAAEVRLLTGSWTFEDALLGKLASDVKSDLQAVRLRSGKISMNFDVSGLKTVYISHARYGSDADSEWELWLSKDEGSTYSQLGSAIHTRSSALVTDSFKVSVNGPVRLEIRKQGTTRINIDNVAFRGTGEPGITQDDPEPVDTGGSETGDSRGIPEGTLPDMPPSEGDNSNMLFGNPSSAQSNLVFADNYLIDNKYFIESYSNSRGTPNWVSWYVGAASLIRRTDRLDNFASFSGLPAGWYSVQSTSYRYSGFDRGHNCPSADRLSSVEANSSTFLMTNMIPQAPNNNQKTWAGLEDYLRQLVVQGNEVYVIMGSYGKGGSGSNGSAETIDNGRVTVPAQVWKVAVILPEGENDLTRVSANTRVIAISTPNNNEVLNDWRQYRTSVREIEKATGYNLLSTLPQSVQETLEVKVDAVN